jgi:hypothetical protein
VLQAARLPGVASFEDFDRYCEKHGVQPGQYGAAFAQWLADVAGRPITGEPSTTALWWGASRTTCRRRIRPA